MKRRLPFGLAAAVFLGGLAPKLGAAEHEMTMTGCLESAGGGYSLATAEGRVKLTGDADYAKHAGHTVKITGAHSGKTMTVSKLEHVSPQCDPSKLAAAGKPDHSSEAVKDKGPTADDQGGSKADREMTAKIRKALVDDDALSSAAKNIKIITQDGKVTLRGAVQSTQEKSQIAAKAEAAAGGDVDNQLTVSKPKK